MVVQLSGPGAAYDNGGKQTQHQVGLTDAGSSGRGWRGNVSTEANLGQYWALVDQLKRTPTEKEWNDHMAGRQGAQTSTDAADWKKQDNGRWFNTKSGLWADKPPAAAAPAAGAAAPAGGAPAAGSGSASSFSSMWGGGTAAQEAEIRNRYKNDSQDLQGGIDEDGEARGIFSSGVKYAESARAKTGMNLRMESEIERLKQSAMAMQAGTAQNSGDNGGDDSDGLADLIAQLTGKSGGGSGGGETRGGGGTTAAQQRGALIGAGAPEVGAGGDGDPAGASGVRGPGYVDEGKKAPKATTSTAGPGVSTGGSRNWEPAQVNAVKAQIQAMRAAGQNQQADAMYYQWRAQGMPL